MLAVFENGKGVGQNMRNLPVFYNVQGHNELRGLSEKLAIRRFPKALPLVSHHATIHASSQGGKALSVSRLRLIHRVTRP